MSERRSRTKIRLPLDAYRDPGSSWLVTMSARTTLLPFADPSFAGAVLAMTLDEAPRLGIDLHLVCLMPDHAHLLVTVLTGDLIAAVGALKSRSTTLFFGFGYTGLLWQRSFHDEGLRDEPAMASAVRYVLNNPVAAGLTGTWEEYDLIGGSFLNRL